MTAPTGLAGWSPAELATLESLAEAFVHGDAQRRATLAAEALETALEPGQVGQLKLALRLLESRPVNLLLTGRPVRFSALDPAARERYLLAWGSSRLALRRSAYQAFRRLLSFLAYGDPGTGRCPRAEVGRDRLRPGRSRTDRRAHAHPPGRPAAQPATIPRSRWSSRPTW